MDSLVFDLSLVLYWPDKWSIAYDEWKLSTTVQASLNNWQNLNKSAVWGIRELRFVIEFYSRNTTEVQTNGNNWRRCRKMLYNESKASRKWNLTTKITHLLEMQLTQSAVHRLVHSAKLDSIHLNNSCSFHHDFEKNFVTNLLAWRQNSLYIFLQS